MLWFQQFLAVCLTLVIVCLPLETFADAFRCYSCTWNAYHQPPGKTQPCRSAEDLRSVPSDSNEFISNAECIRCMKSETWSGGELQSVMRSCVPAMADMYASPLGCSKTQEADNPTMISCMCDGDLCNRAGSFSRQNLWTYVVVSFFVWRLLLLR